MPLLGKWTPMRSMTSTGQITGSLPTSVAAAQVASAWGQPALASHYLQDAYNQGFTARAMGQSLPESTWRGIMAGRPSLRGPYISPYSPYLGTWSPALPGSGIRGIGEDGGPDEDDLALARAVDAVLAEDDD